jgi:hypothetical protein
MIDYSRRKSTGDEKIRGGQPSPGAGNTLRHAGDGSSQARAVRQRSEEVYDINKDGMLQHQEVALLLQDVISTVEKWGQAQVNSAVTASFDRDHNGTIDVQEASLIRQAQDSGE